MLTQLETVKARLGLLDGTYDMLLTNAIKAVSGRFDLECHRTLARTENFVQEFDPDAAEICAACYPIESVAKFELKANETDGWIEQPGVEHLIRRSCIILLAAPLNLQLSPVNLQLARITYTGGYVLPGASPLPPVPPASLLPADLEQAAVEQVAFWFQNRERLGVIRQWPRGGTYEQFGDLDLLPNVRAVLQRYERWSV